MLHDINKYCHECSVCQASKTPTPMKAPLVNVPIGKPWEMVAVDILEVPVSYRNNRYLLVIQDYFTKWAEVVPLPDQTASRIADELVKVFTSYGLPVTLHSDQGRNFESSILQQTLEAFGISKSRTTAYHPQGDGMVERFNRTLLQMLRAYVREQADWERFLPLVLFAYRTASTHQQEYPRSNLCLVDHHILHHFPKLRPMNQPRTMASCIQNLHNFGILLKRIWQKQLTIKRDLMISTHKGGPSRLATMFGCLYPQLAN